MHFLRTSASETTLAHCTVCQIQRSGSAFLHLVNATAQGLVSEQRVTEAVARVMQARIELGLFDPPEMLGPYAKYNASDILSAEHRALGTLPHPVTAVVYMFCIFYCFIFIAHEHAV